MTIKDLSSFTENVSIITTSLRCTIIRTFSSSFFIILPAVVWFTTQNDVQMQYKFILLVHDDLNDNLFEMMKFWTELCWRGNSRI